MKRRCFLSLAGAAAAIPLKGGRAAAAERPNIVLIYADDVGYGDLSCYGAKAVRTPNLDKVAGGGLRMTNAHASSATCTPSRYSLMTGEYAWRKPGTAILPGDAALIVKPGTATLPSMLKAAGYRTGVVGKWHLGLGSGNVNWNEPIQPGPNEIGFDYSFLVPATPDRVPCVYVENGRVVGLRADDPLEVSYKQPFAGEPTGKNNPELLKMHPSHGHDQAIVNGVSRIGYSKGGKAAQWVDEDMVDVLSSKAVAFIDEKGKGGKKEPFFLYYATHDIHVPRLPNRRFAGATGMGLRGDAIAELDWSVGQVLQALDRNGLTNDTLILFSSDNGPVVDDGYKDDAVEKLGEHKPAGLFRGGKYSNFDGGTRVPLLLRWPGHIKADMESGALVSQVDLLSSLAALTGQTVATTAAPDSLNMLPAFLGRSKKGRESLVEHADTLSLIEGNWKYIEGGKGPAVNKNTGTELGNAPLAQLYNLAVDPGERLNLAENEPARVAAMAQKLSSIRAAGRSRP